MAQRGEATKCLDIEQKVNRLSSNQGAVLVLAPKNPDAASFTKVFKGILSRFADRNLFM